MLREGGLQAASAIGIEIAGSESPWWGNSPPVSISLTPM